jgi:hypothetical protein
MLPEVHELDLVLRYEAANDRKLHRVMDRLHQVQADRRAVEAAAAGGSQPAEHSIMRNEATATDERMIWALGRGVEGVASLT